MIAFTYACSELRGKFVIHKIYYYHAKYSFRYINSLVYSSLGLTTSRIIYCFIDNIILRDRKSFMTLLLLLYQICKQYFPAFYLKLDMYSKQMSLSGSKRTITKVAGMFKEMFNTARG